jgi:hypothetical protein
MGHTKKIFLKTLTSTVTAAESDHLTDYLHKPNDKT